MYAAYMSVGAAFHHCVHCHSLLCALSGLDVVHAYGPYAGWLCYLAALYGLLCVLTGHRWVHYQLVRLLAVLPALLHILS